MTRRLIDAHVHLFPDRVFDALWRWFAEHAWEVEHQLRSPEILAFLRARGVEHVVALHYAHKPGMARSLNAYMAALVAEHADLTGMATAHPGDAEPGSIVTEAFRLGLRGVKIHCHVQAVAPDDERLEPIYRACLEHGLPVVIHAGREPDSPAYPCQVSEICDVERIDRVLKRFPGLKMCVPHLGSDEEDAYLRLLDVHETLWLDTAMMVGDYFPGVAKTALRERPDRVMFGTDFPNLPYPWEREVRAIEGMGLAEEAMEMIFRTNARAFYGI